MKHKRKQIALFGGSFDPVHTDHLNMAISCHQDLGFDEIWMIPTFLSPFKSLTYTSNKHRLKMLKIITKGINYIKINEFEMDNNRPTPTIETVKHFKHLYPEYDFAFVIGTDNLARIEEWNHFYELITLINFIVFKRNDNYDQHIIDKYGFKLCTFANNNLSSTEIRKLINLDRQDPRINDYVNTNLLYLNKRLEPFMEEKRYQHCLNVGEMAEALAIKHHVDQHKARIAGTLHDVTKRWKTDQQLSYLQKYYPQLTTEPEPVWHAFTGAAHLQHDWKINDMQIINAVFNHTVGCREMSKLDMIVFCADKISKERDYPQVTYYRDLCFQDLKQGFQALLQVQYEQVKAKTTNPIGQKLQETVQAYLKEVK